MSFQNKWMKQEKAIDDEVYKSERAKAIAEKNREENKRRKEEKAAKQRDKYGKSTKEKEKEKTKYETPQISPMRQEMLKRLALNSDASLQEIKKAYHLLALQYHPDKFNGSDAKFKEILQAYEYLLK
jgi:hypothetical protein